MGTVCQYFVSPFWNESYLSSLPETLWIRDLHSSQSKLCLHAVSDSEIWKLRFCLSIDKFLGGRKFLAFIFLAVQITIGLTTAFPALHSRKEVLPLQRRSAQAKNKNIPTAQHVKFDSRTNDSYAQWIVFNWVIYSEITGLNQYDKYFPSERLKCILSLFKQPTSNYLLNCMVM